MVLNTLVENARKILSEADYTLIYENGRHENFGRV